MNVSDYATYEEKCPTCSGSGQLKRTLTAGDAVAYGRFANEYGKITAIKLIRNNVAPFGLKMAKDYIEQVATPAFEDSLATFESFDTPKPYQGSGW